ncbi:McrC family protein [Spongiibacter marinus]|uniref:McrC family protein n=1 Tax=Spongiibacter marinus TaxID=354246 RepID=UPI0006847ACA|nr:McrC family protein [Spongiibacter marinus]
MDRFDENAVGITKSAFGYLRGLIQGDLRESDFAPFLKLTTYKRQTALKVQNYVGVIQTPCGTLIEILPKLYLGDEEALEKSRYQLIKMLRCLHSSPFRKADRADIRHAKMPLLEVYITQFLAAINQLVKRGIRSDYSREKKNATYLKGRLLVTAQICKNAMHPERFAIEFDEYQVNRPANRLIKLTLEVVMRASQCSKNQRLARELSFVFDGVPASSDVHSDFKKVKLSRGMSYYHEALSWCNSLLNGQGPTASSGGFNTLSLLYPMERIFEDYVAHCLRKNIEEISGEGAKLKTQSVKHSLVESHAGSKIFNLRPDLMVVNGNQPVCVMDTKWKLIDASDRRNKYGISQADMYQLYAYGHKYLKANDRKELMLIYPKTERFQLPLPDFIYEDGMVLRVVPFDVESSQIVI